jgi:hypothetical protein
MLLTHHPNKSTIATPSSIPLEGPPKTEEEPMLKAIGTQTIRRTFYEKREDEPPD